MAVRYCTSKISTFQDIEKLTTFGFRGKILFIAVGSCFDCQSMHILGEALNSINDIAESMQITTKTIHDPIAKEYQLDQSGQVQR